VYLMKTVELGKLFNQLTDSPIHRFLLIARFSELSTLPCAFCLSLFTFHIPLVFYWSRVTFSIPHSELNSSAFPLCLCAFCLFLLPYASSPFNLFTYRPIHRFTCFPFRISFVPLCLLPLCLLPLAFFPESPTPNPEPLLSHGL